MRGLAASHARPPGQDRACGRGAGARRLEPGLHAVALAKPARAAVILYLTT